MNAKQFIVVSYDISDDKRRLKVMKTLEDFGTRVQYSVFECRLLPAQIEKLKRRLKPWVQQSSDSIRFYSLCAADVGSILLIGGGKVTEDRTFYMH